MLRSNGRHATRTKREGARPIRQAQQSGIALPASSSRRSRGGIHCHAPQERRSAFLLARRSDTPRCAPLAALDRCATGTSAVLSRRGPRQDRPAYGDSAVAWRACRRRVGYRCDVEAARRRVTRVRRFSGNASLALSRVSWTLVSHAWLCGNQCSPRINSRIPRFGAPRCESSACATRISPSPVRRHTDATVIERGGVWAGVAPCVVKRGRCGDLHRHVERDRSVRRHCSRSGSPLDVLTSD